jgi:hypothetical protein
VRRGRHHYLRGGRGPFRGHYSRRCWRHLSPVRQ